MAQSEWLGLARSSLYDRAREDTPFERALMWRLDQEYTAHPFYGSRRMKAVLRRQVTVREDKTYHPEICWVGLEPVSNFIMLKQYAQGRSAATWTRALEAPLRDLPVEVIQGTRAEAKGLLQHVQGVRCAPCAGPVLWPAEAAKATSLNLARAVRPAEAEVVQAQGALDGQRQAQAADDTQRQHPRGRPPALRATYRARPVEVGSG